MSWIQLLLIIGLVFLGFLAGLVLRNKLFGRLFFTGIFLLGIIFVAWPDLTTVLAQLIGVNRGTDLLLYLLIIAVFFGGLCIVAKCRQQDRRLTLLVRKLAIRDSEINPK